MKPGATGIRRLINATRYSYQGLTSAWHHEAAIRQEIVLITVLTPLAIWLDVTTIERILLIGSLLLLLIVELLNSAIETVVDRIGSDFHELSGRAKDTGSAAVLITLLLVTMTWGMILFNHFY
ncbi:diacylglycerol kinase [Zooshikella marina]|uniref:Diacylglycerol kinase n=1 Tax=Zooshikella ganghwensis TaxID=202772 RepID=A0A4P9VM47_9GAMM|nr:diacylglycerol kinase [Zooshikella ganghwensis]MBU2705312.1 diacylglycerol kinase [Zooshikella ganghwensis]RDH44458.1 diacylglycerol kinase [Zooshikella ganghwensis]